MATSLYVPIAYITILVTSLALFSRIYRRRAAASIKSYDPWFPSHPSRDIYISLLSSEPPVPDSLLKSALLVRATNDVKRIWRIRDDKTALTGLHQRGLVGDDTMARFELAEKELEAEIVDVVQEANTFRQGWGGMIFQTATEMAHAEKTRDTVMGIPKLKQQEERKMMKRRKYMPNADQAIANMPSAVATAITNTAANSTSSPSSNKSTPPTQSAPTVTTPQKVPSGSGSTTPATEEVKAVTPGSGSGSSTPSKSTPTSSKKKGKKK